MLGMIKKDLFMIKNNRKVLLVSVILYIFYSFMFEVNMTYFLPFMGLMLCISTINYDEFNNWYTYSSALPAGKVNVVKSKYAVTLGIIIVSIIVGALLSSIINILKPNLLADWSVSMFLGEIVAIIFIMSVLYPVIFKFGSEKGRIATIMIGITGYGIFFLASKVLKIKIPVSLIKFVDNYYIIIFTLVSLLMISISYLISKKIYLRREF